MSARLAQLLVAFTLELDGAFEHAMIEAGDPTSLSFAVWASVVQFLDGDDLRFDELAARSHEPVATLRHVLACLERWHVVDLGRAPRGTGSGIRGATRVRLTERGERAAATWRELIPAVEARWRRRHAVARLRRELAKLPLPVAVPDAIGVTRLPGERAKLVKRDGATVGDAGALPIVLARALWTFTLAFERVAPGAPIAMCATTLRVLADAGEPVAVRDLSRLTGVAREVTAIGWMVAPYVRRVPGNRVALSPRGEAAAAAYAGAMAKLERALVTPALARAMFDPHSDALVPPPGTTRAGVPWPASKQRGRDMAAQTAMFRANPVDALPHYPRWDMNRGFGP